MMMMMMMMMIVMMVIMVIMVMSISYWDFFSKKKLLKFWFLSKNKQYCFVFKFFFLFSIDCFVPKTLNRLFF
ncbi:hypothetical protein PPACK8108_LOCUS10470, partial [Phakopsora pachyrhizi]